MPLLPGGVRFVSRCLRVSRAQLHIILRRADDWKDGHCSCQTDGTDELARMYYVIVGGPASQTGRIVNTTKYDYFRFISQTPVMG